MSRVNPLTAKSMCCTLQLLRGFTAVMHIIREAAVKR